MFGTIRRHQTWLWAVIITLTIVSFVVFGPTNTKMGNALRGQGSFGVLAGQQISLDQRIKAMNEVELGGFLKNQQWTNPNSEETMRETYMRLLLIQKQKELGIQVSTEAAATFAHRILGPANLDDFIEKVLKPQGMDAADFERFLHHELGIEQLIMTAGVSGKLVTPQEAETMYRLEHQEISANLVYFSATNYLSSVPVTPEAVGHFYTNQLANYRVPDQMQVSYVKFNVTNYMASAKAAFTNLDQAVESNAQHLGTNLYHGAKTLAESKVAIRSDLLRQSALMEARKAAGQFAEALDQQQPHSLQTLEKMAATNNLTVQTTALFEREYGPQDITVPPSFTQKAFSLSQDDMFGGPIIAEDGVYVMALKQRQPSHTPAFKAVEAKVTADFRYTSAVQLAQQAALKFDGTLTNGLAAGKTFTALTAQSGVKSQTLPPFSLDSRSLSEEIEKNINFGMLKQVAFGTPPGKASAVAAARDGAFILYVEKRLPVDEAKLKQELPGFISYLRQARQNDAFNQWFNAQIHQDPEFLNYVQQMSQDAQMKTGNARRPKS